MGASGGNDSKLFAYSFFFFLTNSGSKKCLQEILKMRLGYTAGHLST